MQVQWWMIVTFLMSKAGLPANDNTEPVRRFDWAKCIIPLLMGFNLQF